ncbi:DUF6153 family protein [Kribbella sp. NPDC050124]|uniref:DUF6153 family protein n=1 Tax=Kribbella sp. NPDC050124 TaxID=3364114 RepID=UPI0037B4A0A6
MNAQDTSARPGPIRALIAVFLLAGVFTMHGLTGNHDASVAMPQASRPAVVTTDHSSHSVPEAVSREDVTVRPAQDGHGHAADVCLAMLTALALAIVGALALRCLRAMRPVLRLATQLTPVVMGPSPPWLQPTLSKLCVLRT